MKLKTVLQLFGCLCILLTIIPFVVLDYWWIRVFDYPHVQLTLLTLVSILAYLIRFDRKSWRDFVFWGILVGCFAFQLAKIYPYTPLANFEILNSTPNSSAQQLSVYAANVLQSNENKDKLVSVVKTVESDILLFMETNDPWKVAIDKATAGRYPYRQGITLSNSYGMLLYSKFPLLNPTVKFIVDDSVPSIHSLFVLPTGDTIQLFAIHPSPPMPQHNPRSTNRDAEMMKTALLSLESKYPVIVVGDFNDVAWSVSNNNFQIVSQLLDPRKGRGLYNTYHADYFFMRWPLDHIFVSEHFRVLNMNRARDVDSDHFPISVDLTFEPDKAAEQIAPYPSKENVEHALEQIRKEERIELH